MKIEIGLVNQEAVAWAKEHAGTTVSQDGYGNHILESTRLQVRELVAKAVTDGWGSRQLAKTLQEDHGFEREHALTIAWTEIARANVQGNLHAWIASGVVKRKKWLTAEDDCEICKANAAQGEIPLLQPFQSGDMGPPAHDRCRCCIAPYVR